MEQKSVLYKSSEGQMLGPVQLKIENPNDGDSVINSFTIYKNGCDLEIFNSEEKLTIKFHGNIESHDFQEALNDLVQLLPKI